MARLGGLGGKVGCAGEEFISVMFLRVLVLGGDLYCFCKFEPAFSRQYRCIRHTVDLSLPPNGFLAMQSTSGYCHHSAGLQPAVAGDRSVIMHIIVHLDIL